MTDPSAPPGPMPAPTSPWVARTLAAMSVPEKVGQLLCVYLRSDDMAEWTAWLDGIGVRPGGILLTPRSREAARADVAAVQRWSRVPVLVAANLEAGAGFLDGVEPLGHPLQIAATRDVEQARRLARYCAAEAADIGVTWAFAPVVDLLLNHRNPITNTRTFGSDRELVTAMACAFVEELEAAGVMTSPKHFPGDGVDDRDQHLCATSNDLSADEWWATSGAIYRAVLAAGARSVMVGHIRQPALSRAVRPGIPDRELLPASLSRELVTGVLRTGLGFDGLVVTDNSAMTGFTSVMARPDALVATLEAGCDMVLGNIDVRADLEALVAAVDDGRLAIEVVDRAVARVLAAKESLGLTGEDPVRPGPAVPVPDATTVEGWRRDLADRSVTLVKDTQGLLPLDPSVHRRVLVRVIGDEPTFYDASTALADRFADGLRARGMDVAVRRVPDGELTQAGAWDVVGRYDLCLYFASLKFVGNTNGLRVAWAPPQGADAPRHVTELPTALVSVADPFLAQDLPMVRTVVNGYTPTGAVVDACLATLFGDAPFLGVSPVDPFGGHWDAAL